MLFGFMKSIMDCQTHDVNVVVLKNIGDNRVYPEMLCRQISAAMLVHQQSDNAMI